MDLQEFNPDASYSGEFFAGLDLAQTKDYSVLATVERLNDKLLLRHLKIFPQPTLYASVLGYLKVLADRWGGFEKIRVDFTREGPSIIADMENANIDNAEGVCFSVPRKSEMANVLKQRMLNQQFYYPLLTWRDRTAEKSAPNLTWNAMTCAKTATSASHTPPERTMTCSGA